MGMGRVNTFHPWPNPNPAFSLATSQQVPPVWAEAGGGLLASTGACLATYNWNSPSCLRHRGGAQWSGTAQSQRSQLSSLCVLAWNRAPSNSWCPLGPDKTARGSGFFRLDNLAVLGMWPPRVPRSRLPLPSILPPPSP